MPELPEVEVCRQGVLPTVLGARWQGAEVRQPRLRQPVPETLAVDLAGRRIVDVLRRGKYLLMRSVRDDGDVGYLLIHLGMSGSLRFVAPDAPPGRHDHVDLLLPTCRLRYGDPRRFGLVLWVPGDAPETHPLLAPLGLEPLAESCTVDRFVAAISSARTAIKPVLMDSHRIVGIGNIYAAESLFRAGISPLRPANRISMRRYAQLLPAIRTTLSDAIAAGGSSIRDYVHSDGGAGCFQVDCAVYERAGQPCRRCGDTIRQIRQSGRSTYYCAGCQR